MGARRARWGGGGGLLAGGWVRARGGQGCGELSRRASSCGRPGGGAAGAGQSRPGSPKRSRCQGGRGQRWGPHPTPRGRIPPSIIHGGESWWRQGGSATPSPRRRTGPGRAPPEGNGGGERGLAPGLQGRGSLVVVGRRGADQAGLWAAAGEGGRGRAGRARGRTPRGPRGLGEGSRGWPYLEGGGCSLPGGRWGPLLSEGGGRACIARCRAMSIHGRAAWDYIPNPPRRSPLFEGAVGGGRAGGCCVHPPTCGGGVAGGSSVRRGRKNPVASPGLVGPFEEEPRIRRGGLRYESRVSLLAGAHLGMQLKVVLPCVSCSRYPARKRPRGVQLPRAHNLGRPNCAPFGRAKLGIFAVFTTD